MLTDKTRHIIDRVKRFIKEKELVNPYNSDLNIGIALSGGADSVALLIVAIQLGWHPIALHCNFHLRGDESDGDERFVDRLCQRLGVPLLKKHFDVGQLMTELPYKGKSVEMVCREVRYDWFRSVVRTRQLNAVALGHHADDNVETSLLNAIRGCGLKGAKGMPPQRDCFIRPLLCISKKEVLALVEDAGENFVMDSSNLENDFQRNKIRNLILPEIERNFPGATDRLARTVENLAADYDLLLKYIIEKRQLYVIGDGDILVAELFAHEYGGEILLFHLLDGKLDREQIATMHNNVGNSGRLYQLSDGRKMLLDRGVLKKFTASKVQPTIPKPENATVKITPPFPDLLVKMPDIAGKLLHGICKKIAIPVAALDAKITVTLLTRDEFHPRRDPSYAWFSATQLSNMKWLSLRRQRQADRMQPFGMSGTRLVSDIFTDAKLSLADKERQLVVAAVPPFGQPEIIWLPGLKNSALFPVTPADTHILEFHIEYSK